ncbi:hypothetical protein BJ508DRAFT_326094 [Ascobolus immersus RN42]|uniref:DUF7025 domain-containing protein n=1 Tax=Ascobolus immersus RN42 TaxID=1160509 RepID=A0A3N4ICJ2_ASCIM|nr:hypothetical protein BJ508DRAFT_326094 [Ascobolus immersus RN42]
MVTAPVDNEQIETAGFKCSLFIQELHYDGDGNLISSDGSTASNELKSDDETEKSKKKELEQHAVVLKKHYGLKGAEVDPSDIIINSPYILAVLRAVVRYYPSEPDLEQPGLELEKPFSLIYHYLSELEGFKADETTTAHLKLLTSCFHAEMEDELSKIDRLVSKGNITFKLLWSLFKPGDLVYIPSEKGLYRFQEYEYDIDPPALYLSLQRSNYNGSSAGREDISFIIKQNEIGSGTKSIMKIPAFPLKYAPAEVQQEIMNFNEARGQKSKSLRGIHIMRYDGSLQTLRKVPHQFFSPDKKDYRGQLIEQTVQGRIIIDNKSFHDENFGYKPRLHDTDSNAVSYDLDRMSHEIEFWPADDAMLLPFSIYGFDPSSKSWCQFNIDLITAPIFGTNAFDRIILPTAPKSVIKALASSHEWPQIGSRDIQAAKGKGLVLLLHGAPGTGKTLTAESGMW